MSIGDTLDYITLSNPISKALINSGGAILRTVGLKPKQPIIPAPPPPEILEVAPLVNTTMSCSIADMAGNHYLFVRLGGIVGASAIIMGAYCKYHLKEISDSKLQAEAQAYLDVANRMHFLHAFVLLTMPLSKHPVLTGLLMTTGTVVFSGCMYYRALTGEKNLQQMATVGGFILFTAWLSMIF